MNLDDLQRQAEDYVLSNPNVSFSTNTGVPDEDDTEFAGKDLFHIVTFWDNTPYEVELDDESITITSTNIASARADTLEAAFRKALDQLSPP